MPGYRPENQGADLGKGKDRFGEKEGIGPKMCVCVLCTCMSIYLKYIDHYIHRIRSTFVIDSFLPATRVRASQKCFFQSCDLLLMLRKVWEDTLTSATGNSGHVNAEFT